MLEPLRGDEFAQLVAWRPIQGSVPHLLVTQQFERAGQKIYQVSGAERWSASLTRQLLHRAAKTLLAYRQTARRLPDISGTIRMMSYQV